MSNTEIEPSRLQKGVVARLNSRAGFGYVLDQRGDHQYIFVFGSAIKRSLAGKLTTGSPVKFRVSGDGRVDELVIA